MKLFAIVCLILSVSCQAGKDAQDAEVTPERTPTTDQTGLELLNEEKLPAMPLTGIAHNHKDGAVLQSNGVDYYIQDLHSWDDRYLNKPVKVSGEIEIRYDAPVFMDTSEVVSQGIPVYSEEEMKAQSKRYWILDAKYEVVRP